MHFPSHFLSVFMVTWSQNEPTEDQKIYKIDKYTDENTGMALFLWQVGLI